MAPLMAPTAPALAPQWLAVESVKAWLRLNSQDTTDDDLIRACAAMTEPYVERCRPEWWQGPTPPTAPPVFSVTPSTADTATTVGALRHASTVVPYARLETPSAEYVQADDTLVWVSVILDDGSPTVTPAARVELTTGDAVPLEQGTLRAWISGAVPVRLDRGHRFMPLIPSVYRPDPETYQGGVMYAAREYRRRNSPAGIELFGDVTSFVSRYDTDIERALQTGQYARPVTA